MCACESSASDYQSSLPGDPQSQRLHTTIGGTERMYIPRTAFGDAFVTFQKGTTKAVMV